MKYGIFDDVPLGHLAAFWNSLAPAWQVLLVVVLIMLVIGIFD